MRTYTGTCEDTYHSFGRYYLGICSQQPLHDIPFNYIYIPQIKKYYEQIYLKRKAFLVPDYGEGWDGSQALEGTSLQKDVYKRQALGGMVNQEDIGSAANSRPDGGEGMAQ